MKKVLSLIILVFVIGLFVFPVVVSAAYDCTKDCPTMDVTCLNNCENAHNNSVSGGTTGGGAGVAIENPLGKGVTIDKLIENFIKSVLGLSGVLALVAFVYGGMFWLVSMGDANKITKGKNIMIWAVFGLAIIFGSYAIITVVYNTLGIK